MRQARHSIRTVADPAGRGVPTVLRCWCRCSQKGAHYRRRESGAQRAVGNERRKDVGRRRMILCHEAQTSGVIHQSE
jgi:hypothetical protein